MIAFPNAKINLGLNVIEKRLDGLHSIESCLYPIPLTDALEIVESNKLSFTSSGVEIPYYNDSEENICLKAYHLLRLKVDLPPISIYLRKKIPVGAGLGGGSSNAAFMIKLLNEKFNLNISISEQEKLVRKLGADCPFFIRNKPAFVKGTGTILSNIKISLKGYYLVLVYSSIFISTKSAYANIIALKPKTNLKNTLETLSVEAFKSHVKNDFEKLIFKQYPILADTKKQLLNNGACYASMTGSGATIFGLFTEKPNLSTSLPYEVFLLE